MYLKVTSTFIDGPEMEGGKIIKECLNHLEYTYPQLPCPYRTGIIISKRHTHDETAQSYQ